MRNKPNAKGERIMNKKLRWLLVMSVAAMTPAVAQDTDSNSLRAAGKVTDASVINVVTGRQLWQWQLQLQWQLHRPSAAQMAAARRRGICWWDSYYEWGDCPPSYRPYSLTLRP
jgi:hypothetical protein